MVNLKWVADNFLFSMVNVKITQWCRGKKNYKS